MKINLVPGTCSSERNACCHSSPACVCPPLRKLSKVMSESSPDMMDPQILPFLLCWAVRMSRSGTLAIPLELSELLAEGISLWRCWHSTVILSYCRRTVLTLLSKGVVVWKRLVGLPACQWILLRRDVEFNVFQAPLWHRILSASFDLKIQPRIFKISSQKCSLSSRFLGKKRTLNLWRTVCIPLITLQPALQVLDIIVVLGGLT